MPCSIVDGLTALSLTPPTLSLGVTVVFLASGIFGSMWATRGEKVVVGH